MAHSKRTLSGLMGNGDLCQDMVEPVAIKASGALDQKGIRLLCAEGATENVRGAQVLRD